MEECSPSFSSSTSTNSANEVNERKFCQPLNQIHFKLLSNEFIAFQSLVNACVQCKYMKKGFLEAICLVALYNFSSKVSSGHL